MENAPDIPKMKKTSPLVLAAAGAAILFAGILRVQQHLAARVPVEAEVAVRGRTFTVEVADTPAKRELGLGKRDSLPRDRGMLFPFGEARRWVFWMKGMRFPIDIVWIRDGRVVDIHRDVPVPASRALKDLKTVSPVEPADTVLELNAGVAAEIGLQPGDGIVLSAAP